MKIGVLAPYSRPWDTVDAEGSGQNVFIRESVIALADRAEVTLFRRRSRQEDHKEYRHGNIREVCVSAGMPKRLNRKASFEACHNPISPDVFCEMDVWIAHYWISIAWVKQLMRFSRSPVLYFSHSFFGNPLRLEKAETHHEQAEQFAAKYCIWCANSSAEKNDVIRLFPRADVAIVPPGHSTVSYEPKTLATGRCLFISRKNYAKGYDIFIELARNFENKTFYAIGREELSLSLPPNVKQLPIMSLNDLVAEINRADIVLCPSRYEHFGLVPLLASFCETPIIASAVGGHLDTIIHNQTGWLCEPNVESFTNALRQAIAIGSGLTQFGLKAHDFVVGQFSWIGFADRIISLARRKV